MSSIRPQMTIADIIAETGSSPPSAHYPRYLRGTFQHYQVGGIEKTVFHYEAPLRYPREYINRSSQPVPDDTDDPMDETGSSVPVTCLVLNKPQDCTENSKGTDYPLFGKSFSLGHGACSLPAKEVEFRFYDPDIPDSKANIPILPLSDGAEVRPRCMVVHEPGLEDATSVADLYCYKEDGNFEDMIVREVITDPRGTRDDTVFSCVGDSGNSKARKVNVSYLDIGAGEAWFPDTKTGFYTTFIDYHNQSCLASGEKTFKVRHFVAEGNE